MALPKCSIIPKPQKYDTLDGTYVITSDTEVLCIPEFMKAGKFISNFLKTKKNASDGTIKFFKDNKIPAEGYKLKISPDGITVAASDENGAFYGAVTLKLMIMQSKKASGVSVLSCAYIYDYPKYSYRGCMMDEARHFYGVDAVKKTLDNMALLKLNKFHWHLCDDQGYRIESEVFPLLNEISSKRKYELLGGAEILSKLGLNKSGEEYFRYYKKDEIREIVEYANKLCIDIIPEIDLPGHTVAILAAYPELSCLKGKYEVYCENGITKDILCVSQEETYDFIEKLLTEITELFPYKYFHMGGDEAAKGHEIWEKDCSVCQAKMKELGLKNGKELQVYFNNRVNDILKKLGKTSIEWNDGIGENTDADIVGHYWITRGPLWVKNENNKRKFIVSTCPSLYFDYNNAVVPLKKVYKFDAVKSGFINEKNVLGLEFESWSEWIDTYDAWEFSVYPRAYAFAEIAWTKDEYKNYKDFYKRLDFFKMYMRSKNINYSRIEKRLWFKLRNKTVFHLGNRGVEYKYNEELKTKELKEKNI